MGKADLGPGRGTSPRGTTTHHQPETCALMTARMQRLRTGSAVKPGAPVPSAGSALHQEHGLLGPLGVRGENAHPRGWVLGQQPRSLGWQSQPRLLISTSPRHPSHPPVRCLFHRQHAYCFSVHLDNDLKKYLSGKRNGFPDLGFTHGVKFHFILPTFYCIFPQILNQKNDTFLKEI